MSDGKMNYERQKARADMAAQIHEASQIRHDRERDMVFIFAAAAFLRGASLIGAPAATGMSDVANFITDATALLEQAKEAATQINKEPDTSESAQ